MEFDFAVTGLQVSAVLTDVHHVNTHVLTSWASSRVMISLFGMLVL